MDTYHGRLRMRQRCVPPVVLQWLDEFGAEQYDGFGGIVMYFDHASVDRMARKFGRQFVKHNAKWLRSYKVESAHDGSMLTCGWRSRRVPRR